MADEITYYHSAALSLAFSGLATIKWMDSREVAHQEGHKGISNDPNSCLREVSMTSYIATTSITTLNKMMKPDTAMNYAAMTAVSAAILDDGGVFTDDTIDANDVGALDVKLLPAVPAVNDAFYIGIPIPLCGIVFDIGEAGVGVWTITWEYYNGAAWDSLEGVHDDTVGFTVAGDGLYVTWTIPPDWATTTINAQGPFYYVRARVSAYTSVNEEPDGDQIFALGLYPYLSVTLASGTTVCFPCQMQKPAITKSNESNYSIALTFKERTL